MAHEILLVMNDTFLGCYMAAAWHRAFGEHTGFKGILLKGEAPSTDILARKRAFHASNGGKTSLSEEAVAKLKEIYGRFNGMEQRMVRQFGVPAISASHDERSYHLGDNINSEFAKTQIEEVCEGREPFFFLYVSQIARRFWIEQYGDRLLNCHSAVLPWLRGIYSIENQAALQDTEAFRRAAGVSIHYADAGVDTGPLIRAERLSAPFAYDSIWDLKCALYALSCRMYTQTALDLLTHPETLPAGIPSDPAKRGPNYRKADFTPERKAQAEAGYLAMKTQVNKRQISPVKVIRPEHTSSKPAAKKKTPFQTS